MINDFVVAGLGIATVFVALVCIIFICNIMGLIFQKVAKTPSDDKNGAQKASSPAEQITVPAQTQTGGMVIPRASFVPAKLENRGEFIAAVSAVIAEDLGTDISHIRIVSVRQRADAIPNRGEICAAISAVISMDTGAEAVRIHSIRRVENRGALCAAVSAVISMDTGAEAVRIHSIRKV